MDGLPVKRVASVVHTCCRCSKKIVRGDNCYSVPQRQYPSRKYFTQYFCISCGHKHIAKILDSARRDRKLMEAAI